MNKRQIKKKARIDNDYEYKIKYRERYGLKNPLYHYECPVCAWDSLEDEMCVNAIITDVSYYCDGAKSFTVNFRCPICKTKFSYRDSY